MACHLSHKLPWEIIHELALLKPYPSNADAPTFIRVRPQRLRLTEMQHKKLGHFARCLATAIGDFLESDRSTEDERQDYDPRTWAHQREIGAGAWPGFCETLPIGYVVLNLLIMDPKRFQHQFEWSEGEQYFLELMLGRYDGCHPPHLADHLRPAMEWTDNGRLRIQSLSHDTIQILRDHAARLFRCMYSISERNRLLDANRIMSTLEWGLFY